MKWIAPESFSPVGVTADIVEQVDTAVAEINAQRPLEGDIEAKLIGDLFYDRIHSSAVTEGNRLSRRETIALLSTGVLEAGSRKDRAEIENLGRAVLRMDELVRSEEPLSVALIRDLHALLGKDLPAFDPGRFRTYEVRIAGSETKPPAGGDVLDFIGTVASAVDERLAWDSPVPLAAWTHWAVTRVHPFRDGNGRLARLLQDYVLLRRHYPAVPLFSEDRERHYYEALESADQGDPQPLTELIAKNLLRVADRYLRAIHEAAETEDWVAEITQRAVEKTKDTLHQRYVAWDRQITALKLEFQEMGETLSAGIPGFRCAVRDYQGIHFDQFRDLVEGRHVAQTWVFGVDLAQGATQLRFVFWACKRRARKWDPETELTQDPALMVSMEDRHDVPAGRKVYFRTLDDFPEAMITLREVVVRRNTLLRRRFNPVAERDAWDFETSSSQIVRDFLQEALQRLSVI